MKYRFFILILVIVFAAPSWAAPTPSTAVPAAEWAELRALNRTEQEIRLSQTLERSLRAYDSVQNYKAVFHKQEKSEGRLGDAEKIFMKFEKPWKIYMGWLNTEKKNLQVVYERGKHDGKLAIHKPGLALGLLPVIFLDQNSPWVKKGSESYRIEDAGIGSFLTDFTKAVLRAARENKLRVQFSNETQDASETAEITFEDTRENSGYFAYRILVSFDRTHRLPVKMVLYDWQNQLMGHYAYENLALNVSADDPEFARQINRSLYRVYRSE